MKSLNKNTFILILFIFPSFFTSASPNNIPDISEYTFLTQETTIDNNSVSLKMASVEDYIQPRVRGACFSARNCSGTRIGSHQHAHNCKNAGGKSWRSGVTGQCTNL